MHHRQRPQRDQQLLHRLQRRDRSSSSPSSRRRHSIGWHEYRAAGRTGPEEEQRAWHRRSCRRKKRPVRVVDRPEEEEESCTDSDGAGHTGLEEGEAGNHRRLHQWEEEVKSTGAEERGIVASPTVCGRWLARRSRSAGSVGRTAAANQGGDCRRPEVEEVQKEGEPVHRNQGWVGHKERGWAGHMTVGAA